MAKSAAAKVMTVSDGIDKALLKRVADATAAGQAVYLSSVEGNVMVLHNPPLIEVDISQLDPSDNTKALVRISQAGSMYLAANAAAPVAQGFATPAAQSALAVVGNYALISNAVLPEPKKRGNSFGSGAPTKYPFATMEVGQSFFSANTEHAKGDAVKALGSTVSSQNRKYAVETGETKTQKRAKRDADNNPVLENGKKVIETVTLPVLKYERKFTIREVEAGKVYGGWIAPADGALIQRSV